MSFFVISRLNKFSLEQKRRLIGQYRQPFYLRTQHNNVFLSLTIPQYSCKLSAGSIPEYKKKKKKKKSYMAGLELGTLFASKMIRCGLRDCHAYLKGSGAPNKGIFQALARSRISVSNLIDQTPIAHNGTRPTKPRRL